MKNSKVRELRIQKGLTQKEFGETIGTTGAYILQIETGKRRCSNKMAKKIEKAFDVPWYTLCEDALGGDTG